MKPGKISPVLLVVLGVSLGLLGFIVFTVNPFGWDFSLSSLFKTPSKSTPPSQTPKPTPIPIVHGTQTYTISGNLPGAPKINEVIFDPLDPGKGDNLNLTVNVIDKTGVKSVDVVLNTDNKSTELKLNFRGGTDKDGTWRGSIKIDDSYDYIYRLIIKARNTSGKLQSNTISIR